jgi:protein arginine kinase
LSVLQNARLLATVEALEFLSALRLGASLGLFTRLKVADVDRLILLMQPGHLQNSMGLTLTPEERDEMRAEFLRRKVCAVRLKC